MACVSFPRLECTARLPAVLVASGFEKTAERCNASLRRNSLVPCRPLSRFLTEKKVSSPFSHHKVLVRCSAPVSAPAADSLLSWLLEVGLPRQPVQLRPPSADEAALVTSQDVPAGGLLLSIPENFCVTSLDVSNHPIVSALFTASSTVEPPPSASSAGSFFPSPSAAVDIAGLAWWLLFECQQGTASPWYPLLSATFPELFPSSPPSQAPPSLAAPSVAPQAFTSGAVPLQVASPLLWPPAFREQQLRGTSIAAAAEAAVTLFAAQHAAVKAACLDADPAAFPCQAPSDAFSLPAFLLACALVSARAVFLPSAGIYAIVPLAHLLTHSPSSACLDFDPDTGAVSLVATEATAAGQPVSRCFRPDCPPAQLLLTHAILPPSPPASSASSASSPSSPLSGDWLPLTVGLVPSDPLLALKRAVLADAGLSDPASFPLFPDRFPRQLLAFMRLQRLADVAQLPALSFTKDSVVGEMNEYEALSVLLTLCLEGQTAFLQTIDDDQRTVNLLQSDYASEVADRGGREREEEIVREWLAAQLRLREKRIWGGTVSAVRRRLAPIRGLPSKQGMADPNAEIKEMFGAMEAGLSAPKKLLGLFSKKQ